MKELSGSFKILSLFLWLVAAHSFIVGIGIIFLPESIFKLFGLNFYPGDFFRFQGGVFHIVMSLAYAGAAVDVKNNKTLIILCIAAKFIATVFLLGYYFFVANINLIVFSGIGDFLMGMIVLYLLLKIINPKENKPTVQIQNSI